jgi:hypothetical protein
LSCSDCYTPSCFAFFVRCAWRVAAAPCFCLWLFILGRWAGRLNASLCGALHVVLPLMIWFWSAFPWLLCNIDFKCPVAGS